MRRCFFILALAGGALASRAVATTTSAALASVFGFDGNARHAFQHALTLNFPAVPSGTPTTQTTSFTVPAGKRLVIEYVAGKEEIGDPALTLTTSVAGVEAEYPVRCSGQLVRVYADGGTPVRVTGTFGMTVLRNRVDLSVSGYLVDLP